MLFRLTSAIAIVLRKKELVCPWFRSWFCASMDGRVKLWCLILFWGGRYEIKVAVQKILRELTTFFKLDRPLSAEKQNRIAKTSLKRWSYSSASRLTLCGGPLLPSGPGGVRRLMPGQEVHRGRDHAPRVSQQERGGPSRGPANPREVAPPVWQLVTYLALLSQPFTFSSLTSFLFL